MKQSRSDRSDPGPRPLRSLWFGLAAIGIIVIFIVVGPKYLVVQNEPECSDAVIIMAGRDTNVLELEARKLVRDGFARYIMNPHSGLVRRFKSGADIDSQPEQIRKVMVDVREEEFGFGFFLENGHLEDTHLEILIAKGMMARMNFRSAVIVSYPYHLRRIGIITKNTFPKPAYKLSYRYPRTMSVNKRWWVAKYDDVRWVLSEYVKIAYFLAYTHLS